MALRFSPSRGAASFALSSAIRGPTGAPGADGLNGAAATVSVNTTTTLQAGAAATAANAGSSSAALLNFGIPRGADAGMRYAFESSTSMAAPAAGGLRLNNATLASVTAMAINATNSDGIDVSDFAATWDDSTNTVKGYAEIRREGSGAALGLYQITSVTDNTTWLQLALIYVSGSGSFSAGDAVYVTPYRVGNKGADGAGTGDVVGPAASVDSEIALFSSTTGKLIKRATTTGLLKAASGVLSAASAGTDYCAATSGSSVLKGSSGSTAAATAGTDFMKPDTTSALTAGFTATSGSDGTKSSGTYTPDPATGNFKHITANGAFTLAPPSATCTMVVEVLNGASAGAITTSGFTKVNGDTYDTTNANKWAFHILKTQNYSRLTVESLN